MTTNSVFWKIKKRKNLILQFVFILNTFISIAQHTKAYNMEYLKSKKKQELIQMALLILKDKQPSLVLNPDDFETTAWKNSTEILIKFRRYIRFIPLNTEPNQYYDITINLITKQILPFESGYNFSFYIPSEEDKKKLNFIKQKTDFQKDPYSEITITENMDYYWISNFSKTSLNKFFIKKGNGFKSAIIQNTFSEFRPKAVLESIYEQEEKIQFFDEEETTQKTKKAIIEMGITLLEEKHPSLTLNFDDYESNVLGDSKNTLVEFKRIIRYVPVGTDPEKRFSYDITVNLNTNEIAPFDDYFKLEFYIETEEDKKAIEFIKKNFGGFSASFENTIHEGEKDYSITSTNKYSYGKYVLNKETGEKKATMQGSYMPMPAPNAFEDLNIFTEINN